MSGDDIFVRYLMNPREISVELQAFLRSPEQTDPDRIRLAGKAILGYPARFVADQLEARKKQARKLPTFCADPHIVFPPLLNLEQSSSETTAAMKVELVRSWGGSFGHLADLTAGFGVDALAFSRMFDQVTAVEPNEQLREIAKHNFSRLSGGNVTWTGPTAEAILSIGVPYDWIYIDPSRRKEGSRVVLLEDCTPDVIALKNSLLQAAPHVLIKAAPMLDISLALRSLTETAHVAVVSVGNECREVLFHLVRGHVGEPEIVCLNRLSDGSIQEFSFHPFEERNAVSEFSEPMTFLFEPNASVLKAGAFRLAAARFGLMRMAEGTHIYTGDALIPGFPGRTFEVIRPLVKKETGLRAGIITRNHPLRPEEVARKYGITEGEDGVVIGFSSQQGKHLLLTRKR